MELKVFFRQYKKPIFYLSLAIFLVGIILLFSGDISASPGDYCNNDNYCAPTESCVENSCCLDLGVSCSGSSSCCTGNCDSGTGTCQSYSGGGNDCTDVGDCLTFNQTKVCDSGQVITLNYMPGGCGNCQYSVDSTPDTLSSCCADNPTDCLYACFQESANSASGCGSPTQCVTFWSTTGSCSGFCEPSCPNSDTYCEGAEPSNGCAGNCPTGTKSSGCIACGDGSCDTPGGETCLTCSSDCGPCSSDSCVVGNCNNTDVTSANCRVGSTFSCPAGESFINTFPTNQCSGPDWRCDCCGTSGGGSCVPTQSSESTCNDSIDNDCDGDTDCSDSNCASSPGCGANNANCDVRLVSYPSTADPGSTFQVTYDILTSTRNEHIDFRREGTLLGCIWNWNFVPAGQWQEQTTLDYSCPSTPGTYNFELRCRDHWMAIEEFCGDNNSAWLTKTFQVQCEDTGPTSVGHIRIQGPSGMIKLNLISASDVPANMGVVKVARTAGDTNTAADLVLTTDPDASPVRIMTPYGIRSWRKLP